MKTTRLTLLSLLIAFAVVGCGGSSTMRISGSAPKGGGFTEYTGPGFAVAVPAGWQKDVVGPTADGRTITGWGPPTSLAARVTVEYYAHPGATGTTIDTAIASFKDINKYLGPALRVSSTKVATASVSGAASAKLVTQRGSGSNGPHYEQTLLVQTHAGPLIQLTAVRYAGSTAFDPTPVVDSFHLTGTV